MSNIDSEHSWQIAQTYASQIGEVPSIFSACVRMIQSLEGSQRASNIAAAKQHVADAAGPLVRRSPSLQAIFYYAAETLYPTQ